jgi:4-amino-4-deoxy-L-arabinose transferase-like glycosyltransferase
MPQPQARIPLAGAVASAGRLTGALRHALAVKLDPTQGVPALAQRLTSARQATATRVSRLARDRWLLAALAISVVALALRLVGDRFGLPAHYLWDEPTIVNRAVRMGNGDLNPHFFYYPGLTFYITFIAEAALYVVGHVTHAYPSTSAYAIAYFTDSTPFYVVGRVLAAFFGAGTCVVTYLVGKRFFAPVVGLIGAAVVALSPVAVANGHFTTLDVPMAFFTMLAYLGIWQVYARGSRSDYLLAGAAIGLGIATKYLPGLLLVSLVLAHVLRTRRETGRWQSRRHDVALLAWGVGATVVATFITSPYTFLDWRSAIRDYSAQSALSGVSQSSTAPINFGPYLTASLPWSVGWPAYLAALAGLVAVVRARGARRLELLLFLSFPALFFLVIGSAHQPFTRYLVTLVPFLALGAGAVVWWCAQQAPGLWQRYLGARWRASAAAVQWGALSVLLVALLAPTFIASTRFDAYLSRTDARTAAATWFDTHIPTSATIAIQPLFDRYFLTAPIMTTTQLAQLEGEIPATKPDVLSAVDGYYHAHGLYRDVPFVYDLAKLQSEGVRYVVLSSASTHNSGDAAAADRFYAALRASGRLIARFGPPGALPDADLYPVSSPIIMVYALPAAR